MATAEGPARAHGKGSGDELAPRKHVANEPDVTQIATVAAARFQAG